MGWQRTGRKLSDAPGTGRQGRWEMGTFTYAEAPYRLVIDGGSMQLSAERINV